MSIHQIIRRRLFTRGYPSSCLAWDPQKDHIGLSFSGPITTDLARRLTQRFARECNVDNVDRSAVNQWYANAVHDLGLAPFEVACDLKDSNALPIVRMVAELNIQHQNHLITDFYHWLCGDINKSRIEVAQALAAHLPPEQVVLNTASEKQTGNWNLSQRSLLASYQGGSYARLMSEYTGLKQAVVTDRFLRFVLRELADERCCGSMAEAQQHLNTLSLKLQHLADNFSAKIHLAA